MSDSLLPSSRSTVARADSISQSTAVEQARAVAEVQAAVMVAQSVPRDRGRAEAEMRDACSRLSVANRAFYSLPRSGQRIEGPTVHLARELARIWGNVDYGVRELRRDDEAGVSEIQAFAWDQQANVRSTRTFIVPHAKTIGTRGDKRTERIVDLGDIYLNNQNVGARAVRECIFTILPEAFTEEAQGIARRTLADGEGESLTERIAKMVGAFRKLGVTEGQIEARTGAKRTAWTAGDLATLLVVFQSIDRGEATAAEMFPEQRVTTDELAGTDSTPS